MKNLTIDAHKPQISGPWMLWNGHLPPIVCIMASINFILDSIAVGELAVFQTKYMLSDSIVKPYRAGHTYSILQIISLK